MIIGFRVGPAFSAAVTYKLIKFSSSSDQYYADWSITSIATNAYMHSINFAES